MTTEGRVSGTTAHPSRTTMTKGTTIMPITLTRTELTPPAFTITPGVEYDILPDDGPLLFWSQTSSSMRPHSDNPATFRPTRVTVVRIERRTSADANVRVRFVNPGTGRETEAWVHHSFLLDPDRVQGVAGADAHIQALVEFMATSDLMDEEWSENCGTPNEWAEDDWQTWATAGCAAVLTHRADIEAGTRNAGRTWCVAARDVSHFAFDDEAVDHLHQWFVDNRGRIDTVLANVPVAPTPNPTPGHVFVAGELAAFDGRLVKIETVHGRSVDIWWQDGRVRRDSDIPFERLTWMEPGVARLRRRDARSSTYGEVCVPGQEYVFERCYGVGDRAIYVLDQNGARLGYMCHSDFEPVLTPVRREVLSRVRQDVWMPDGSLGLILDADPISNGAIIVYQRHRGSWSNRPHPVADLDRAMPGDRLRHEDGRTGVYAGNRDDANIDVTFDGGGTTRVERTTVRFVAPGTPVVAPDLSDLIKVVDGVEYVRKDVVDADISAMTGVLHRGSVDNNLCGVYDRVTAQADQRTTYVKMGQRYRPFTVTVRETLVVERIIQVEQATDEESAIRQAREQAANYTLRNIPTRLTGEVVRIASREVTPGFTPVATRVNR